MTKGGWQEANQNTRAVTGGARACIRTNKK